MNTSCHQLETRTWIGWASVTNTQVHEWVQMKAEGRTALGAGTGTGRALPILIPGTEMGAGKSWVQATLGAGRAYGLREVTGGRTVLETSKDEVPQSLEGAPEGATEPVLHRFTANSLQRGPLQGPQK